MVNLIPPIIPEPPVRPMQERKNKKEVLYFDGPVSEVKNLREKIEKNPTYHLFFQVRWPDHMGYDITRDPAGAEFYLIADRDLLKSKKKIDADKIFEDYDMIYLPDFGENKDVV